jgi:hypothetical protein
MGRVGSALDNAAGEAFNSTIKVEYIHRHHFRTWAEARGSRSGTEESSTLRGD